MENVIDHNSIASDVRMGTCPWCGKKVIVLSTSENLESAEFVYSNKNDSRAVARNPCMCSNCHGVGGREDFFYDENNYEQINN